MRPPSAPPETILGPNTQCRTPLPRSEERRVGKECRSRWPLEQAEDGIRGLTVTGVQTCALPIFEQALDEIHRLPGLILHERATDRLSQLLCTTSSRPEHDGDEATVGTAGDHPRPEYPMPNTPAQIGRASCRERV